MSRIGKKPILIPDGVEAKIEGSKVSIKGSKGELSLDVHPDVKVELKDKDLVVLPLKETKQAKALWGTTRALLANMAEGVVNGFKKELEIQGVGYKANIEGKDIVLNMGFSHPVKLQIPEGIEVSVEKNIITVSGIDKELIGQVASNIRKVKPPEPYKGKGIRYVGEIVRRKVGKKAVSGSG